MDESVKQMQALDWERLAYLCHTEALRISGTNGPRATEFLLLSAKCLYRAGKLWQGVVVP